MANSSKFRKASRTALTPVAEYVRMSTDQQQYSIENQQDANRAYAASHRMEIVRTYADAGRSGVTADKREDLQRLMSDVRAGPLDFEAVLTYDVSRWGRYQDPDEAAFYEYFCRRAGLDVVYVAEPFSPDQGPLASLVKTIKRLMAGEFSRELGAKTFDAMANRASEGTYCGGAANYGLRRIVLAANGARHGPLERGQGKRLQSDRTALVLGPEAEVRTVRRIFDAFVDEGIGESAIARMLNREGLPSPLGVAWRGNAIHRILKNERYLGHLVWAKSSLKLQAPRRATPPEAWIRSRNMHPAIVDVGQFERAQAKMQERASKLSDEEILQMLKDLLEEKGRLSSKLIDSAEGIPSQLTYVCRFGSLQRAYDLIGYAARRNAAHARAATRQCRKNLAEEVERRLEAAGCRASVSDNGSVVTINRSVVLGVKVLGPHASDGHPPRRELLPVRGSRPELMLVGRREGESLTPSDYYLFPVEVLDGRRFARFPPPDTSDLAAFRSDTLDCIEQLVSRLPFIPQDDLEEEAC